MWRCARGPAVPICRRTWVEAFYARLYAHLQRGTPLMPDF